MKDSVKRYEKRKLYEKNKTKVAFALAKEEEAIHKAIRNLGWLPIQTPYHHGWVKTYDLYFPKDTSMDLTSFWAELHKIVNQKIWSATEDFRYKDWKGKWHERTLHPKRLTAEQYKKLNPKFQKVFDLRYMPLYRNGPVLPFYYLPERSFRVFFKERKYKRIVTHIRENNPELDSRLEFIHHKLWHEGMWRIAFPDMKSWRDDWSGRHYYKCLSADERMSYDFHIWEESKNESHRRKPENRGL